MVLGDTFIMYFNVPQVLVDIIYDFGLQILNYLQSSLGPMLISDAVHYFYLHLSNSSGVCVDTEFITAFI